MSLCLILQLTPLQLGLALAWGMGSRFCARIRGGACRDQQQGLALAFSRRLALQVPKHPVVCSVTVLYQRTGD